MSSDNNSITHKQENCAIMDSPEQVSVQSALTKSNETTKSNALESKTSHSVENTSKEASFDRLLFL